MFLTRLTAFMLFVALIHALDDHAYKIKSVVSNTTVRVDMDSKELIVSDEEYPGWSEFFYMFADPGGDTFTLANFGFRETSDIGVDCSVLGRPCVISQKRTHFRLTKPPLGLDTENNVISVDGHGVWSLDSTALPNTTINFESADGSARQKFILLRWE